MNRQAKSAIKSLVLNLRHKLEEDIAIGLKRYGFAGERWLPIERLPHIERDDAAAAGHFRLRAALEQHLRRIGAAPDKATPAHRAEAVEWFVREVAFTHLNRLVALKCLEARGLIPEIITTRDAYGGRARAHHAYRFDHPAEAAGPDDALPAAIRHVCRMVYPEFRLLFDVGDPATGAHPPASDILWPAYPVLRECIALINGLDEAADVQGQDKIRLQPATSNLQPAFSSLWLEDEIIGWVYQFYNAEQKTAIRDRGAPQRPAEVAVINQFFTPRWIVKFLVDNTLGRLWLEMHPDSPRVRAKCDYLVPEPSPAADASSDTLSQTPGGSGEGGRGEGEAFLLDPDSPINNPKAPPRRTAKRPEDIRLIDPACGAMHFGHYAFEVFQEIYRDYYELFVRDADLQSPIFDLPSAILRHNLFGVDIDLRAVQLAALSLFIKAKSADATAHITQMNLVVADAVLPADRVREQFLAQYEDDKAVQDAVRQVLDEMANVAEVGSLLRVEERLRTILARAGHRTGAATAELDPRTQRPFPGMGGKGGQLALADLPEVQPDDWGAHYTVARLLDDLRDFAARALQTHDLNAQLFAEEAEKSVHLLDVFLNDYDVAVMNPPYGDPLDEAKNYLRNNYPLTRNDLYAAFFERALDFVRPSGYVGALTSRTFLYLSTFADLREKVMFRRGMPIALLDLGSGMLDDAAVQTAATILKDTGNVISSAEGQILFLRLETLADKARGYEEFRKGSRSLAFQIRSKEFSQLPGTPFVYWAPAKLRRLFRKLPPLQPEFADAKVGIQTGSDETFVRAYWEVPSYHRGVGNRWKAFAKGGNYCRYYADFDLVVDWEDNGKRIRTFVDSRGHQRSAIRNENYYFRQGITYINISSIAFSAQLLPENVIFSVQGQGLFPADTKNTWTMLAVLNSELANLFLTMINPGRHFQAGHVAKVPFVRGTKEMEATLAIAAERCYALKAAWDTGNETCTRFDAPWLVQARRGALLAGTTAEPNLPDLQPATSNLQPLLDHLFAVEHAADARLQQLQAEIDDAVYDLYEITPEDRALIERELGNRPPELVWPQMEGKADDEKRREHVRRLVSWCVLQAVKEKRDGILPVTPVAGELAAVDAVRRGLEAEFGEAAAYRMESDIGQVLGQALAGWLDGPFIKWHTQLYKRRPVIWHLASPKNGFGCLVYIHKLDADTLRKVQTLYLWPRRRGIESERDEARRALTGGDRPASRRLEAAEALLDDLAEFERRLLSVIQAQVKCNIPDWAEGPFRNGVYDPVLDDGVKVNITPLQEAGVLRYGKVV